MHRQALALLQELEPRPVDEADVPLDVLDVLVGSAKKARGLDELLLELVDDFGRLELEADLTRLRVPHVAPGAVP